MRLYIVLLYFCTNNSTCFGWYLYTSTGAHVNCNCIIWHWSNRICYLPLSWRSRNIKFIDTNRKKGFINSKTSKENYIEQTQLSGATKFLVPTPPRQRKLTNMVLPVPNAVITVYVCSWWWLKVSPETCGAVCT